MWSLEVARPVPVSACPLLQPEVLTHMREQGRLHARALSYLPSGTCRDIWKVKLIRRHSFRSARVSLLRQTTSGRGGSEDADSGRPASRVVPESGARAECGRTGSGRVIKGWSTERPLLWETAPHIQDLHRGALLLLRLSPLHPGDCSSAAVCVCTLRSGLAASRSFHDTCGTLGYSAKL